MKQAWGRSLTPLSSKRTLSQTKLPVSSLSPKEPTTLFATDKTSLARGRSYSLFKRRPAATSAIVFEDDALENAERRPLPESSDAGERSNAGAAVPLPEKTPTTHTYNDSSGSQEPNVTSAEEGDIVELLRKYLVRPQSAPSQAQQQHQQQTNQGKNQKKRHQHNNKIRQPEKRKQEQKPADTPAVSPTPQPQPPPQEPQRQKHRHRNKKRKETLPSAQSAQTEQPLIPQLLAAKSQFDKQKDQQRKQEQTQQARPSPQAQPQQTQPRARPQERKKQQAQPQTQPPAPKTAPQPRPQSQGKMQQAQPQQQTQQRHTDPQPQPQQQSQAPSLQPESQQPESQDVALKEAEQRYAGRSGLPLYAAMLKKATIDYSKLSAEEMVELFTSQLNDGYLREALSTLKAMSESGYAREVYLFEEIVKAWASKRGRIENAMEVFVELEREGLQPTEMMYGYVVSAYAGEKRMLKAMKLFNEMKAKWIALGAEEDRMIAEVEHMEEAARQAGQALTEEEQKLYAAELERRGRIVYFRNLWGREAGLEVVADVYASLIDGWCRLGEFVKAEQLYKEALGYEDQMMKNVENILPEQERTKKIYLFGGRPASTASMTYEEEKRWQLREEKEVALFNSMILNYGKGRQMPKALGVLEEMRRRGLRKDKRTHLALLEGWTTLGDLDKVEETVQAMNQGPEKLKLSTFDLVLIYQLKLRAYAKRSDTARILMVLDKDMVDAGIKPNASTFNLLLEEFARKEDSSMRNATTGYLSDEVREGVRFVFEEMKKREIKASLSTLDLLMSCDDVEHVFELLENPNLDLLLSLEDSHWELLRSASEKVPLVGGMTRQQEYKEKIKELMEKRDKLLEEKKGEDEEEEEDDVEMEDF